MQLINYIALVTSNIVQTKVRTPEPNEALPQQNPTSSIFLSNSSQVHIRWTVPSKAHVMGGLSSFYIIQLKLIKKIPCTTHVQNSGDYSVDGEVVRIRERDTTMLLAARASDKVVTVVFEGDEHVLMPA